MCLTVPGRKLRLPSPHYSIRGERRKTEEEGNPYWTNTSHYGPIVGRKRPPNRAYPLRNVLGGTDRARQTSVPTGHRFVPGPDSEADEPTGGLCQRQKPRTTALVCRTRSALTKCVPITGKEATASNPPRAQQGGSKAAPPVAPTTKVARPQDEGDKKKKRRKVGESQGPPRQSRGRPEKGRKKLAPPNPKKVDRGPAGANLSSLLRRVAPSPIRRGETLPYRKGEMLPPHRIPPPPPPTKEATEEWSLVVGRKAGKRLAKRDDAAQGTTPSATKSKAGGRATVPPPRQQPA